MGNIEPRVAQKIGAGAVAAALHLAVLVLAITSGAQHYGRDSGDTPTAKLLLIEAPDAYREEGRELPLLETPDLEAAIEVRLPSAPATMIEAPAAEPPPELRTPPQELVAEIVIASSSPDRERILPEPSVRAITSSEQAELSKQLELFAEDFLASASGQLTWEHEGRQYSAKLIPRRASDGTQHDRMIAQVSASDRGQQWTTEVKLKRLAFSQYSQFVDRWDPMVQLHEDEIVGRFHSNTQFNMLLDRRTSPTFLGKVTTAARNYNMESQGRLRESEIFKGGVETKVRRIALPEKLQPFEWAPAQEGIRIHEIAKDTRIIFFPDGSYTMRADSDSVTQYVNEAGQQPVYFVAAKGVVLRIQGTVAGKVMIYSPERIVIEGDIKYANDPRDAANARDYLGIVCDRYVEIAPAHITGPGDLEIHGAIFAGRRFIVTDIDYRRSATLKIYGSLSAGTLTASEPRYATKIEYDERFETRRPPGFPATNKFEVEEWDGQWTEVADTRLAVDR